MTLQIAYGGPAPNLVTARHRYCVYGIAVVSDTPLALPRYSDGGLGEVECLSGSASFFHRAARDIVFDPGAGSWYRYAPLGDGSSYVRWESVGEFLVNADGSFDNGIASANKLGSDRVIVPVQVIGDQGPWDRMAWKTNAFYGNPLTGFSAP